MINSGILNPQILSLLARVRHTNALVISPVLFSTSRWRGSQPRYLIPVSVLLFQFFD